MFRFAQLIEDPPPEYVFELSEDGIAFARRARRAELGFRPIEPDVLSVSPLRDNVLRPDVLAAHVAATAPAVGMNRRRRAALILPDFCARVTVLDFDSFPSRPEEQMALVRFRTKKTVPFDVDSAAVSFHAQPRPGAKKYDVVVAAVALEIVARYEAPFRAAGFQPGLVTPSSIAMLDLVSGAAVTVVARLAGRALSVSAVAAKRLRLVRTVELEQATVEQIASVLYPTCAYLEDELGERPSRLLTCGFPEDEGGLGGQLQAELGLAVEPLESRWGRPAAHNAGLIGYLESLRIAA